MVDDNKDKISSVVDFINSIRPNTEIATAHSYNTGLSAIFAGGFDAIFLDMSMPLFDQDEYDPDNEIRESTGREMLTIIDRQGVAADIYILTQYRVFSDGISSMLLDEVDKNFKVAFKSIYRGIIYFSPSESGWKNAIRRVLEDASEGRKT